MKQIKRKLKDRSGSTYIDLVIGFFIACICIAIIIQVIPALVLKNQLNTYATDISRIISVEGCYDNSVKEIIERYKTVNDIHDINISLEGTEYMTGTEKIQLNDPITVTVSKDYDLGFFNFGSFKITLTNKAIARSEVYWK